MIFYLFILKIFQFYYRPKTKFAKVMFSQVSVCPQGGVHVWWVGGMCGGGHACVVGGGACVVGGHAWWWGACVAGGHAWWGDMHGGGPCMAGGAWVGGGHAWQEGMCGRVGHAWQWGGDVW